jgi:prephenate dehydratase
MGNKLKIGVMGGQGSFSEEAGNYYCHKHAITDYEIEYSITAEKVLSSVNDGSIDLGVFPIENSNGGIVYEAVYAMAKYNFNIENMFEIDIRHNLLVRPGTNPADITAITSHQQALKQCRMYLKRKWPEVEPQEYKDTAEAARDLASGVLPATTAVIANRVCAELYGLEILEEGIQDLKFNFTTFVVASKVK